MTGTSSIHNVWAKALEFLGEAERIPAAATPRMATHAAYYAMFHGARAVLLKIDGAGAPAKHRAVVNRFGFHAKRANDARLMAAGRAFNRMEDDRIRSDYGAGHSPPPTEAVAAVVEARRFLETCASLHGFPPP